MDRQRPALDDAGPSKLGPGRCRSESVGAGAGLGRLVPVPRRDRKKRCNFRVIAFMKIHGNILENSLNFKVPWRKCYIVFEGNSPATLFSGNQKMNNRNPRPNLRLNDE